MWLSPVFAAVPAPVAASSAPKPKIVIVGASGFIGKATVLSLVQAVGGDRVVVATRNPEAPSADAFKSVGASVVKGDLNHPDALKDAFVGASSVFIIAPGTEVRHRKCDERRFSKR